MQLLRNILISILLFFLLADFLIVGYFIGQEYPGIQPLIQGNRITLSLPDISISASKNQNGKISTSPSEKQPRTEKSTASTLTYTEAIALIEKQIHPKAEFDNKNSLLYLDEGKEFIYHSECYRFSLGQNFSGHFRKYRNFAVSLDGSSIYELEPPNTEYKLIWNKT